MKIKTISIRGLTMIEALIVIAIIAFLASLIPVDFSGAKRKAQRIQCVNNLKNLGTTYRTWNGGSGDIYFPAGVSEASGGWNDRLKSSNQGSIAWKNYFLLSNELTSQTNVYKPKILICPSDERSAPATFSNIRNENISYFIGVGGRQDFPQSILAGDRNLGPGLTPKNDFGFSPADGKGNDVILQTNTAVCWSLKMHSDGNVVGSGNVLLGDGSVQQVSSARFMTDLQCNALDSGNFPSGYVNQSNSYRLIFP